MTKDDAVNHPSHYNSHPSGVECITITEHMTFNVGNAIKYLWRAGLKIVLGSTPFGEDVQALLPLKTLVKHIEDLKKARWYIDREILRIEQQVPKNDYKAGGITPVTKNELSEMSASEYVKARQPRFT